MKGHNYSHQEIEQLIEDANKRAHAGRSQRLKVLLSLQSRNAFPAPALALEYYEEARLCWYVGAYVATIVMTQMAFEELLRSHYRVAKGVSGILDFGRKKEVDKAGFFDLINEAEYEGWILKGEAELLHNLRKNLRNIYVHVKDIKMGECGEVEIENPGFLKQLLKIVAPELTGGDVIGEAKEAIQLLVILFPKISSRSGGL